MGIQQSQAMGNFPDKSGKKQRACAYVAGQLRTERAQVSHF